MPASGPHRPTLARRAWAATRRYGWLAALVLLVLVPAGLAAAYVAAQVPRVPAVGDLRKLKAEHPSVLLTSDGKTLAVLRKTWREWVPLQDVSPAVVHALLATEDHRFYEHGGLDWRRTLRAAYNTLGGRLEGGSTLTQQLARNLYPQEIGRAVTLDRKIREAIAALRIEAAYGKDEILEIYLNTVPFLYNAYGIEMAARTYFGKPARALDVLEAATLVGMLKGTRYYNPVLNPARAQQRRNLVLAQMARHGQLPAAQLEALKQRPLQLKFERQDEQPGPAPHFTAALRRWLADWADRHGYDIHTDGLVVRTTLDARAQALATQAVQRQAERLQALADGMWSGRHGWDAQRGLVDAFIRESPAYQELRRKGLAEDAAIARLRADRDFMQTLRADKTRLQAGLVAIEPGTGYVRAWVGSRDFAQDQFDHVAQARRQPGSTFKPFAYAAAFELGGRPQDQLLDQPVEIALPTGQFWRPADMAPPTLQPVTLRDGLAQSKNTITAQVVDRVGPGHVAQVARAMGVRASPLEEVHSLALGTSPVTLREMVSAYGTIANGGQYVAPTLVLRVEDRNGRVLQSFAPAAPEPALDPVASAMLLDALRAAVDQGTGSPIRTRHGLQGELAGKTGTTQHNTDGWFILVHPQLVTGAWVGFNDNRITMGDKWGTGARSALPAVGDFVQQAVRARLLDARAQFQRPPQEVLDQASQGWGSSLFPPLAPPQPEAPEPVLPDPTLVIIAPGDPNPYFGGIVTPQPGPEPAIVVGPPRTTPPQAVAAPARPPGEASGAGRAFVLPAPGSY